MLTFILHSEQHCSILPLVVVCSDTSLTGPLLLPESDPHEWITGSAACQYFSSLVKAPRTCTRRNAPTILSVDSSDVCTYIARVPRLHVRWRCRTTYKKYRRFAVGQIEVRAVMMSVCWI